MTTAEYTALCASRLRRLHALTGMEFGVEDQRILRHESDDSTRPTTGRRWSTKAETVEALDAMIYGAELMLQESQYWRTQYYAALEEQNK